MLKKLSWSQRQLMLLCHQDASSDINSSPFFKMQQIICWCAYPVQLHVLKLEAKVITLR